MPLDKTVRLSESQFCELLGLDPQRLVTVKHDRTTKQFIVVQVAEDERVMNGVEVAQLLKKATA